MRGLQITLRAARVNCGFTLKEVAHQTGRSTETISKYEIDSTNIPRDLMVELIALYQVPDEHIFFGKESSFHGLLRSRPRQPA
ncbi:helix-turn-helix domain-containing protein [Paenibacillus alkalitolerans]|uniref:helix-turn-helix domain-containing protein n=1 Tax=Paenibacillus alkalitolerans TaxID=2799335 RepID=UPI0018F444E9|nr:helix-turn-helix transcriptional regulator [Paenibacillus alkalitolerans]